MEVVSPLEKKLSCFEDVPSSSLTLGPEDQGTLGMKRLKWLHTCSLMARFQNKRQHVLGSSWRHKIAVVADVGKFFQQIEVDVHDRDALRYLWIKLNINEPPQCCQWDNELSADTLGRFTQVSIFSKIRFERSFNMDSSCNKEFQIPSFGDASKYCFAAAVYILVKDDFGNSKSTLLIAKSRLRPKKPGKVAIIGLIAKSRIRGFKNVIVIGKQWVSNRVREINSLSDPIDWRHVPDSLNPTDLPSRGLTLAQLPRVLSGCPARRVDFVAPTTPIIPIYDVNNREHLTTSLRIVSYVLRADDAFNGKVVPKSLVLSAYESRRHCFITPWGHYQFKRYPLGLSSAQDVYNRLGDEVIEVLINVEKLRDDKIISSSNFNDHIENGKSMLKRCPSSGMTLSKTKFKFAQEKVKHVGFFLSQNGIQTEDKKLQAIQDFPAPTNISKLRRFLGMANQLGGFVKDLGVKVVPLRKLLKKKHGPFIWTHDENEAINQVKKSTLV
ncbi:unnamed protein product [Lepeophtheirus salmonis]|uniref:(salmon louse) hypothetical protein n=1 Tax=Lepeophtheirus salmonis TaxID=72036 RepID=A0A7R8CZF7_LEPSM|nr:unnamed protein product [Lepeophtheirus salmonis]CAF2949793.1 unnamed protein product [Lepeophtheirus salmonis]